MNVSREVILAEANRESWTMPITGLLDWGDTMFRGTIMICSSSAFAATDWGTCLRCIKGEARGRGDGVPVTPPTRRVKATGRRYAQVHLVAVEVGVVR